MQLRGRIVILLLCSAFLFPISFLACREGVAHDQTGLCELDISAPPPFLGFEYWTEVGVILGVLATGLVVAVFVTARNSSDDADSEGTA